MSAPARPGPRARGAARALWRAVSSAVRVDLLFARFPTYDAALHRRIVTGIDPVRESAIAFALRTVIAEDIPGAIAEGGVYQGHTSALLRRLAPGRRLYLFDTFEGFPDRGQTGDGRFADTSIEAVKRTIGDSRDVEFRAGLFPDTAAGLEGERFAFVMLDFDRYEPTKAGLEFFYPRLSPGGFLFAHDYNSPESGRGVSRAFREFLADKPERVIELPDVWGSVVLRRAAGGPA